MKYKKVLSFFLSASLMFSPLTSVYAYDVDSAENEEISADAFEEAKEESEELTSDMCEVPKTNSARGTCGEDLGWNIDDNGILTISGTGDMYDYAWNESPFYNNESIKKVMLANGVTSIGEHAFYDCEEMISIAIPDSVVSIGNWAFSSCKSLVSVEIPYSVRSIGYYAFGECSSLTSVTIPDGVETIEGGIFEGCSSLKTVFIPDSVTRISDCLFRNCTSLTSIVIPRGVEDIDYSSFDGCTALTSITIPDTVRYISDYAFNGCTNLTEVHYFGCEESWKNISIYDNNELLLNTERHYYSYDDRETVVEANCLTPGEIHSKCTACGNVLIETIPASGHIYSDWMLNYAGLYERVCYVCDYIETAQTIMIESGRCGDFITWTLDSDGTLVISGVGDMYDYINYHDGYGYDECSPFYNDDRIVTVIIESGVTSIGNESFEGCTSMVSLKISESVSDIGGGFSFYKCKSFNQIIVDENNETYMSGEYDSVLFSKDMSTLVKYLPGNERKSFLIPDGVEIIADRAFAECIYLESVTIPDDVTHIGESAFSASYSINSVTVGNGITSMGGYAFSGCQIENVYITDIEKWCNIDFLGFYSNPLHNYADLYLNGELLTDFVVPEGITSIKDNAFEGCYSFVSITIPDYVTSIGREAFYNCDNVKTVTIGSGVRSIGWYAFSSYYLESVTIAYGMTTIDTRAFNGCKNLKNITIPDSVTSIGDSAFYGCESLAQITLPDSVTSMDSYAFYGCESLTQITIPKNITEIDSKVFSGCKNLTSIVLPKSLCKIGASAFEKCTSLTDVYFTGTEDRWNEIEIEQWHNECLLNANIIYNYKEGVTGIRITSYPKTVYEYGEEFSFDGAVVVKTYFNGSFTEIEDNEISVSGYDKHKFGLQFISVSWGEFECEYKIEVVSARPETVAPAFDASTTVGELVTSYPADHTVCVFDTDGKTQLSDEDILKTGCTVQVICGGEVVESFCVAVSGDTTGDGIINAKDLIRLKKQLKEGGAVEYIEYADVNRDGVITEDDVNALMQMM